MLKLFEENPKLSWFATAVIAIGIFIISSTPNYKTGYGISISHLATLYHFFAFFFFGLLLMISLVRGKHSQFFIPAIIISILYSILDELHQFFIPGRYSSFGDVVTDSAGILLAFLIYYAIIRYRS